MGHRTVATGIMVVAGAAVALTAFLNATPSLARWVPWVVALLLAVATLSATLRSPRSPAIVGFAVFGWTAFIPVGWLHESPPTETSLIPLIELALRTRRPAHLPPGFKEVKDELGMIDFEFAMNVPAGHPVPQYPPEMRQGGPVALTYNAYNERHQACLTVGNHLTILAFGMVGALAGMFLARDQRDVSFGRVSKPERGTNVP